MLTLRVISNVIIYVRYSSRRFTKFQVRYLDAETTPAKTENLYFDVDADL